MSSRQYSITEPHPSVRSGYIGGGRGGAGNFKRYKAEELTSGPSATGPASRISLTRPQSTRIVTGGRGGFGNVTTTTTTTTPSEDSIFQFDEEMLQAREAAVTPVYRIGRGGAGNVFPEVKAPSSQRKNSSDSSASESSGRSVNGRRESGMFSSIFSRRSS